MRNGSGPASASAKCQSVELFDSRTHRPACSRSGSPALSMQKLKAVVKKHYSRNYDSDSTGYSSSSDRPISRSQFILRPSTGYSGYPSWDYTDSPSTSYCSEQSSDKFSEELAEEREDTSTVRARTPLTVIDLKTPLGSPFPFDEEDDDLGGLFDELELKEEEPPPPIEADLSTLIRKKLLIKDPDENSKIYFSTERLKKQRSLPKKGSIPRSILKKEPSLIHMHIYEEIEDDHLDPFPGDVRPELPDRPKFHPIRIFPPCKAFKPRRLNLPRYPSTKRRKKMPSLHKTGIKP